MNKTHQKFNTFFQHELKKFNKYNNNYNGIIGQFNGANPQTEGAELSKEYN